MYIPKDLVFYIFSFLNYEDISDLNLNYEFYKEYIKIFTNKVNEYWIKGIYNNNKSNCFNCSKFLGKKFTTIICIDCELDVNKYFSFPMICIFCTQISYIKKKMFSRECICCGSRVVHLITDKFN